MTNEEIDVRIDEWHNSADTSELHEYLGWTWSEYRHWVETNEQPAK